MYSWSGVSQGSIIGLSCVLISEVIPISEQNDPEYCCLSEEWNPVWPVLSLTCGVCGGLNCPTGQGKVTIHAVMKFQISLPP